MKEQLEGVVEIEAVVAEFYEALNALFTGDVAPMAAIWSHSDDVTYLGPQGGILVGWEQVLSSWNEQAVLKLGGKVEPKDMQIVMGEEIGFTQNYEIGTNFIHDKAEVVKIRATNIFRKEEGSWKMISHQTDLLSYLENIAEQ